MVVFGVTFLVAVVLLGMYGLRVRTARLRRAEKAIDRLEDAIRQTGAAIGRVESEAAAVTDVVKASLTSAAPAKPAPKAEPPTLLRTVLRREPAPRVLRYYVAAYAAGAFRFPKTELVESELLRHLLFSHTRGGEEREWLALLRKAASALDDASLLCLAAGAPRAGEFLEAWQCDIRGSALGMAKTPKGGVSVFSHHSESGY
jgi:hypothetical protein